MTVSPDSRNEELINLIVRCAIRDQAALKMLFDRISPYLNAIVYRIVKSDDIGKEVLQEAFLQIWSNAHSYRPHLANPLKWMARHVIVLWDLCRWEPIHRRYLWQSRLSLYW